MRRRFATLATLLLCVVLAGSLRSQGQAPPTARSTAPAATPQTAPAAPAATSTTPTAAATATSSPQHALIDQYCMGCHSDRVKSGGLALSTLNLDAANQSAEVAEKV